MAYRDRVRDEAIAAAKAFAHPEVEARHLLWGLVQVLDSSTPASVARAAARALLPPRGEASATPAVPAAIEARLEGVTNQVTAIELCSALGAELLGGGAERVALNFAEKCDRRGPRKRPRSTPRSGV